MSPGVQRPLIALVGRPNVGKSTLFNRLIGARKAVVSPIRGTTRDRIYGQTQWRGLPLAFIDTGGFEFAKGDELSTVIQRHLHYALEDADGLVLVCDAKEGLVPADEMISDCLRKTDKPVVLAVNKLDHGVVVPPEFFSLGIVHTLALSALHGRGTGELLDHLVRQFSLTPAPTVAQPLLTVAIIGRQNVGKSSLLNAFLREERAIVSERPGTTRDAIDASIIINGEEMLLVDTAGLRHRRKVKSPIDLFSMVRSTEAMKRCDVAFVVLDATQGLTRDDQRLLTKVREIGCGLVVLLNKWDLVRGSSESHVADMLRRSFPAISRLPILATSAKTGFHVQQSLAAARQVFHALQTGVPNDELTALLQKAWHAHLPPRYRGRVIRLEHVSWRGGRPASLELRTSGRLPGPYQHYLLKTVSAHPTLLGVPVKLIIKPPQP